MERNARRWARMLAAVLAGTAMSVAAATPVHAATAADPAAIDRFVAAYAAEAGYPGVAVAITNGDRTVHVAGYGHDSTGAPMTATTPMPVASVSKAFTALAVMQLVDAGRVGLDAPLHDYVPDFRVADPRGARITVRHLLDQTSGITDGTLAEKRLPQPASLSDAVVRAHAATLAVDPGTKHYYTNTNYHLAARLVEVVSGEPFDEYLRRHVLEPAGMLATITIDRTPADVPASTAPGYVDVYGLAVPVMEPDRFVAGSDGVITTAEDMARWLRVQTDGGVGADGTRLVAADSVAAMHTSSDPRWTYGMGWDTSPDGRVRHGGVWFTGSAGVLLLPSGHGIAVITNSGFALGNDGTQHLEDGLAELLTGGTPTIDPSIGPVLDVVFGALTLLTVALGIRALRRRDVWARRFGARPHWWSALRLAPRALPLIILMALPDLLGLLVGGGRDITLLQLWYYGTALVGWLFAASIMNIGVAVARVVALVRLRRSSAPTPVQVPVRTQ